MLTREKAGILLSSQFYVVVDAHPKSECWLLRTAIIAKTYFLLQSASSHVYKELEWWTTSGQAGQCREESLEGTSKCSLQVWRFRRHSTWSDVQDRDRQLRVLTLSRKRREARRKQSYLSLKQKGKAFQILSGGGEERIFYGQSPAWVALSLNRCTNVHFLKLKKKLKMRQMKTANSELLIWEWIWAPKRYAYPNNMLHHRLQYED